MARTSKNRYGLGSMFQEEGPGLGPSSDLMKKISDARNLYYSDAPSMQADAISEYRRAEERKRQKEMKPKSLARELDQIREYQKTDLFAGPEAGLSDLRKRQQREAEARRIDTDRMVDPFGNLPMTMGVGPNELSPLDAIAEQLRGLEGSGRGSVVEKPGERAQYNAEQAITKKMDSDAIGGLLGDPDPAKETADADAAVEDVFMGGVAEMMKSLGQEVPDPVDREASLKKYMEEFSQATGIPIDGKVDKSQALMALGLGLMQNRAGKGFNVGRILNAVGQAGESAMPYLTKAKDEAKQARIAAGKYALDRIKSDEDARQAIITSNEALRRELMLKDLDYQYERKKMIDEALLEGDEDKLAEALKNTEQKTIKVGASTISIGTGQDLEAGGRSVFSAPEFDARAVADAYKKTGQGLNTLRQMENVLLQLKDQSEGQLGGTALQGTLENLISVGNSMGMNLEYPSGDDVALTKQLEVLQRSVLARFKKFLTQETGNGISNVDVEDIKAALGNFETFEDIDKAIMSVSTMQDLFLQSQNTLDPIVDMFMDRRRYRSNDAGTESYNEVTEMFAQSFGDVSIIQPNVIAEENGQKVIDYDIRSGI